MESGNTEDKKYPQVTLDTGESAVERKKIS